MVKKSPKAKAKKELLNKRIVNSFGGVLYFNTAVQWLVVLALYIPIIVDIASHLPKETNPSTDFNIGNDVDVSQPTILTFIGASLIVAVILGLTVYTLGKIPTVVAKAGRDVVKKSSSLVAESVIKVSKKQPSKKLRDKIAPKVSFYIKLTLIIAPVALSYLAGLLSISELPLEVAIFVNGLLASWGGIVLLVQYSLAEKLAVKPTEVW